MIERGSPSSVAHRADPAHELSSGVLGTADITFMVIAAAAPMAIVVSTMPFAFALGNGAGVPGSFLLVTVAMVLFAIGYVRLIPNIPNAGAFYAIIATAMGRSFGLAAAYIAAICYIALSCSTLGALSYFTADLIARISGVHVNWGLIAAAMMATIGILSYFRITLAATVLAFALTAEMLAIIILDIAILVVHGVGALRFESFAPSMVFSPGFGVAALYAFNACIGFEGTAIYQEEARDRTRTVPRATYIAIAVIGVFYVTSGWCLTLTAGAQGIKAAAGQDPGHFIFAIARRYLGQYAEISFAALVLTSAFAATLGLFNNGTRYVFALARDGVLPKALSWTHPRFRSPVAAAIPVLVIAGFVIIFFLVAGLDPLLTLTTSFAGFGSVGLMALLALTAFAVPLYFARHGKMSWMTTVPPIAGGSIIAAGTFFSIENYSLLSGVQNGFINQMPWALPIIGAFGFLQAQWLKRKSPVLYDRIGAAKIEE